MSDRVGEGRSSSKKASKPQCFKCGKRGHLSKECTATGEERAAFKARQKENKANKANKANKKKEKEKTAGPSTSSAGAKGRKTRSQREPSLAQQAFEEPLIRSIILSFLNPYQPDDLKAVISFHQLGLMSTEDLDYYFRTTVPAIILEKMLGFVGDFDHFRESLHIWEGEVMMANTPLNIPVRMDRYLINHRMDVDKMKDIIRTCLCEGLDSWDKDGSKRKWLKGKSRAQVWKKYKYLSYVPIDVFLVHYRARELSKTLKKGIKKVGRGFHNRAEDPTFWLLPAAVRAGMNREIGQLVNKYKANPESFIALPLTHLAASYGHTETVKYLIEDVGMDVSAFSDGDQNLVHWAAASRRLDTLKYVCSSFGQVVDPHAINEHGVCALQIAATMGSAESCEYLIDEVGLNLELGDDSRSVKVITGAVEHGHVNVVRLLVDKYKMDPKRVKAGGGGLLLKCVDVDMMKLLVDTYKLDVNTVGSKGRNVVHVAVYIGRSTELLHLLVDEYGVDVNAKDEKGWNALHLAAKDDNANMLRLLVLKYGMDVRSRTNDGMTVAEIAPREDSSAVMDVLEDEFGIECDYGEWDTDTDGYSDDESFDDDGSLPIYDGDPDIMMEMMRMLALDGGNRYGGHFDDYEDDSEFDDSEYSEEDSEYSEDSDEHEICSCCGGVIDPDGENSLATSRLDPTTGRPI